MKVKVIFLFTKFFSLQVLINFCLYKESDIINLYHFFLGGSMKRLTKRYIIHSLDNLNLSKPIRYERYYINDHLRIQKKEDIYQKEILDSDNVLVEKENITEEEFLNLKKEAYQEIIRNSYLYLEDERISIKEYLGKHKGLFRVEVKFDTKEEMDSYQKESWMEEEITLSPLAFDKYLSKLSKDEFLDELNKFLK